MEEMSKKHVSENVNDKRKISRKEALKRAGYYAFSAATMMLLLNKPEKAQADDTSFAADDPDTWPSP